MSTFLKSDSQSVPIRSIEDLYGYFARYAKPMAEARIGIESELFGVKAQTGEPLPFSGHWGIEAVLKELAAEFDYGPIYEGRHIIALQKGGTIISLEPGGQVELSAEPVKSVHEVRAQLDEFFAQIKSAAHSLGDIAWLSCGMHPFAERNQMEWVPKERYRIMARYLAAKGTRGHDMMLLTAGDQINLDYENEEDAICKMRLALALTPIASAMFANSSISGSRFNGFASERLNIWRCTDPERSGLILNLICKHCTFLDYLNYVLAVPMMFLVRGGRWIMTHNLTFREFIERGYQGLFATIDDFKLHLSTIFSDARFKQYMEIRGADGQRGHLIPAVSAFWKGILYDAAAKRSVTELLNRFEEDDFKALYVQVERKGLAASIGGVNVLELAREAVRLSEEGLARQHLFNEHEQDERIYLEPLKSEVLREGKTPAEQTAELWKGPFRENRSALIDYLKV